MTHTQKKTSCYMHSNVPTYLINQLATWPAQQVPTMTTTRTQRIAAFLAAREASQSPAPKPPKSAAYIAMEAAVKAAAQEGVAKATSKPWQLNPINQRVANKLAGKK